MDHDQELNQILDEDYFRKRGQRTGEAWAPYRQMRLWRRLFFCSVAVNLVLWICLLISWVGK